MVIVQNKISWVVPFDAASIDDSIASILQKMVLHHVMVMPVVDANGCFSGVVRAVDIMRAAVSPAYHFISDVTEVPELLKGYEYFLKTSHDITAKDVMEEDDTYVAGEDLLPSQLFYLFAKHGHERMFVVDTERKVSGMIALADVLGRFNAK